MLSTSSEVTSLLPASSETPSGSTIEQIHLNHKTADDAPVTISVRNISKMYRIYDRPQDRLKQMFWRGYRQYGREFWALRDLSFSVKKGETVGIIGRNGSGKSTLLQIIAGTLAPTEGDVEVNGRVAALLELGSGFNPEFTGRENVFMNGSILGFSLEEMEQRFDEIVAFADIGEFIDQPVKIYSSGMMVRLAFAVQAHLQPDVLIVDEALSVGDIYFQHKCMRHIKQMVDRGMTLLFVSHSTETVKRFCQHGLWLDSGRVHYFGEAGIAVEKYLAFMRMREAAEAQSDAPEPELELAEGKSERSGVKSLPDVVLDDVLVAITGPIDLADERLFLRGIWEWTASSDITLPIRRVSDPGALAGFCCYGGELDLIFLRGPDSGSIHVLIDGEIRVLNLYSSGKREIERLRLVLPAGKHIVMIGPAEPAFAMRTTLSWLGGYIQSSPRLIFRRDPDFGTDASAVERYGNGKARLTAVDLLDYVTEQPVSELAFGQRVRLRLHGERLKPIRARLEFSYIIRDRNRIDLFGTTTIDEQIRLDPSATQFVVEFAFDVRLGPGSYSILVAVVECSEDLGLRVPMDQIDIAKVFTVAFDPLRPVWYLFHEPVVASGMTQLTEQNYE